MARSPAFRGWRDSSYATSPPASRTRALRPEGGMRPWRGSLAKLPRETKSHLSRLISWEADNSSSGHSLATFRGLPRSRERSSVDDEKYVAGKQKGVGVQ